MNIQSKLLLGQAMVSALVVATGATALLSNTSIEDAARASDSAASRLELIEQLEAELRQSLATAHEVVSARHSHLVLDLIGGDAAKGAAAYAQFTAAEHMLRGLAASAGEHSRRWDSHAAAPPSAQPLTPAVTSFAARVTTFLAHVGTKIEKARQFLKDDLERHYRTELVPHVARARNGIRADVAEHRKAVTRTAQRSSTTMLWAVVITVLLAVIMALVLVRLLVRPLSTLRAAALDLGQGQLDRRVPHAGNDEIGDVGRAFNEMATRLGQSHTELEAAGRAMEEKAALLAKQGEDLARARDTALEATRLKSEFLANMSHEIRTPLNGICGTIELLRDTPLDEEQSRFLDLMHASSDALLAVIGDILDLSKIEAGKLDISSEPFSLRRMVTQALQPLYLRARKKGIELLIDLPESVPEAVVGDAIRLRQILLNLVGNAVKFTERGEIVVRVRALEEDGSACRIDFAVVDTGIGIPADKLKLLFQPFTQVDGSSTRRFGGTGLGLAISAKLVDLMRGEVRVESEFGHGSTFAFSVPLGRVASEARGLTAPTAPGRRVLVLDDNPTASRLLVDWLSAWRMRADPFVDVSDVPKALARAKAKKEPYDLLILDADRPPPGGFALLESMRDDGDAQGVARLILGSGLETGELDRARSLSATYISKPVTPSSVFDAIQQTFGSMRAVDEAPTQLKGAPDAPLRVLLAEDNPINSVLAAEFCRRRGHDVTAVPDGRRALEAHASGSFDVLLVDLQMPHLDGFGVAAEIREREATTGQHLPIIALTAHAMEGYKERCLAAGMDGYLTKPIEPDALYKVLREIATNLRPIVPEATVDETPPPVSFDLEALTRRVGGDEALALRLASLYRTHAEDLLSAVSAGLDAKDASQTELAAHSLKGALRTLGANEAVRLVARVEDEAHHGRTDVAREAWDLAQGALCALGRALAALPAQAA
jgi:signal transduction histidine kinase/CheY-like chemotaxis protein/HPt (histidine-containing phosphotransfer) domain-containing protein